MSEPMPPERLAELRALTELSGDDVVDVFREIDRLQKALSTWIETTAEMTKLSVEAIKADHDLIQCLRAEVASLKAERDDCPTCAGDGVIFGVTTKAEGEDWVERVDSESIDPCPECEGTKRSLVTRQKALEDAINDASYQFEIDPRALGWIDGEREALRRACE